MISMGTICSSHFSLYRAFLSTRPTRLGEPPLVSLLLWSRGGLVIGFCGRTLHCEVARLCCFSWRSLNLLRCVDSSNNNIFVWLGGLLYCRTPDWQSSLVYWLENLEGSIFAWLFGWLFGRPSRSQQFWCYSGLWRCSSYRDCDGWWMMDDGWWNVGI